VDDARIAELTAEVLADLRAPQAHPPTPSGPSLEGRVAALEAAVHALQHASPVAVAVAAAPPPAHPSLQLIAVPSGGDRCLIEPDKPCVESGMCRALGH
jgi:hypothetical protein